jgi:hypothetical protein
LAEFLQFLEVGKKTGLLSVEHDQPIGVINFEDGEISFAQTHMQEGTEAVFEILSISQGKFHFFPGKPQGVSQTKYCVTELLMHWVHRVDETGEMLARQESDEFNLPF